MWSDACFKFFRFDVWKQGFFVGFSWGSRLDYGPRYLSIYLGILELTFMIQRPREVTAKETAK